MTMITKRLIGKAVNKLFLRNNKHKSNLTSGDLKAFKDIPGPRSLPFIGTTWKYMIPSRDRYDAERLHLAAHKKFERYGPLVRETLSDGSGLLSVFDPEDIKSFMNQTMAQPDRRSHLALKKYRLDRPHMYSSGGLLPSNGEKWRKLRKSSQVVFGRPDAVLAHLPDVDEVHRDFVRLMRKRRKSDNSVDDLLDQIKMMNLEVMLVMLINTRFGCLAEHPSQECKTMMAAGSLSTQAIFKTDNGPLQLYRFFKTPLFKQLADNQDYIYSFAEKQYEQLQDSLSSKCPGMTTVNNTKDTAGSKGNEQGDGAKRSDNKSIKKDKRKKVGILEGLCRRPELDKRDIIGLVCDSTMSGVDTTSFTLAFTLYYLANNSNAQRKLAQEAKLLLDQSGGQVTSDVLSKARYTLAVLKESMRLSPVSIGIGRINTSKPIALRGYLIPAGTTIVSMNQHIGRNIKYFPEPLVFRPERFLDDPRPHSHALLPFGQGSRSCIAQNLAKQMTYTALLHILYNFELSWTGGVLDCKTSIINEPDGPLHITLVDRDHSNKQ